MAKEFIGVVVSDKMDKTVIVQVERMIPHPLYRKPVRKRSKFVAHDPENKCKVGDMVRIRPCRPLSKTKRWKVVSIVREAQTADLLLKEEVAEST